MSKKNMMFSIASFRSPLFRNRLAALSCTCALLLSGCAAGTRPIEPYDAAQAKREALAGQKKPNHPATEVIRRDVMMPVMSSINTRIRAYEQKVEDWRAMEGKTGAMVLSQEKLNRMNECRSHLQHLLLEYNALQRQLQLETQIEAAQLLAGDSLLQLNQQDIEYLESGCGTFLNELRTLAQPVVTALADPPIKAAFESADYAQVINLYVQMGAVPGQSATPETIYLYGQALLKNHQEAEAQQVLAGLLDSIWQQRGQDDLLLRLLQSVADLHVAMERYDQARGYYEELLRLSIAEGAHLDEWAGLQLAALQPGQVDSAEMKEYSTLLGNYLAYAPKRDGYNVVAQANTFLFAHPATRLAANVDMIKKNSREQADASVNQRIKQIEAQAEERSRGDASSAVNGQGTGPVVQPGLSTTASGQPVAVAPQVLAFDPQLGPQEDYDKGMAHLQAGEYDKAIEQLNRLQGTPLEAQAHSQSVEASRLGAQDMRQKAAELFVRATKSRNPDVKRKLLLSSRDLLQEALVKYPQSGLVDKVQKNILRIEGELRAVDASTATPVVPAPSL